MGEKSLNQHLQEDAEYEVTPFKQATVNHTLSLAHWPDQLFDSH